MVQKERCVIILSGGPDSTTVAYWAKNTEHDVFGLSFKYGQIAVQEVEHATRIAEKLELPLKIINLSSLKDIFRGVTSLCDVTIEMTSQFSQPIIVPFRNGIFLAVAVAYAISIGATKIFYGAHGSDETNYPDCRKAFYESFTNTAKIGTDSDIHIEAPFSSMSKSEIITLGQKLDVPFHLTWSCYLNGSKHCGRCESCVNRRKAFEEAGILDPTEYVE